MTARLTIEYDGTGFAGWANQPGERTIQAELERALCVVLRRESVPLTVAGRTDAGVHAWAQVASHEGEAAPLGSLNALLPPDVSVIGLRARAGRFRRAPGLHLAHVQYRVLARAARPAVDRAHVLHWTYPR